MFGLLQKQSKQNLLIKIPSYKNYDVDIFGILCLSSDCPAIHLRKECHLHTKEGSQNNPTVIGKA